MPKPKSNFNNLIAEAPLIVEDDASFYLYRLKMGDREQTGLVASCSVDEYDADIICKHERTRKDKEDDRTQPHADDCARRPGRCLWRIVTISASVQF